MPDPIPPAQAQALPLLPHIMGPKAHASAHALPVSMPILMLVEDSRYTSEMLRHYARALGLRLRRAADMHSAGTHLRLYRPDIVLVDLGLPDGRGEDLIAQLAAASQRVPLLIATSGQSDLAAGALAAGADMFIEKPFPDVTTFRALLLAHFPGPLPLASLPPRPAQPRPDRLALQDDLDVAAKNLSLAQDNLPQNPHLAAAHTCYAAGLLDGVACSLGDNELQRAARRAWQAHHSHNTQGADGLAATDTDQPQDNTGNPRFGLTPLLVDAAASRPNMRGFRQLWDLVHDRLRHAGADRGI